MADIEKVKRGLACCTDGCSTDCPYTHDCRCGKNLSIDSMTVIEELQAEIERLQPKWIPVSERLPEEDENVLVLIDTECSVMRIVNRDKTDVWHWDGSYCMMWANWNDTEYADICDASHWMPLPKPPKKEGDWDEDS